MSIFTILGGVANSRFALRWKGFFGRVWSLTRFKGWRVGMVHLSTSVRPSAIVAVEPNLMCLELFVEGQDRMK